MAKVLPNHHITKPVYIGEVQGGRPVRRRLEDAGHGAGRRLVRLPAGQQGHRGGLGDAEVRQLQHEDEGVLGTELQVMRLVGGGRRLLAAAARRRRRAASASRRAQSPDDALPRDARRAARRHVRRQGSHRRAARRQRRIRARGACSPRCSKIASTSATADQKIFIVKSADDALTPLDLIDPLTLQARRHRPRADDLDQDRHEQPPAAACCGPPSRASACRARTRRCASPPSRR